MPRKDILEKMDTTKEEWIKTNRILRDDKPHDDDLKWLGTSKEDFFETKRRILWMDAFRDGFKGRDVSEMGRVMEKSFVMNGVSTSSAT